MNLIKKIVISFGVFVAGFALAINQPQEQLTPFMNADKVFEQNKKYELYTVWTTYCRDCKKKLKGILPEWNQKSDLAVITVNTDRSQKRGAKWAEKNNLKLPVLRDEDKAFRKSTKLFSVPAWALYSVTEGTRMLLGSGSGFDEAKILSLMSSRSSR